MRHVAAAVATTFVLVACGNANWSSIYRTYSIDGSPTQTALIDARQRAIISGERSIEEFGNDDEFIVTGRSVVCAEPSPDALSALSAAFAASASGTFGSNSGSGALESSLVEAASQIGVRNATIQILRDGYYRLCEAYMNNAIDEFAFVQTQNKFLNAMLAAHAIEQLAPTEALGSSDAQDNPIRINLDSSSAPSEVPGTENGAESDTTESRSTSAIADGTTPAPNVQAIVPSGRSTPLPPHVSHGVAFIVDRYFEKMAIDDCMLTMTGTYLNLPYIDIHEAMRPDVQAALNAYEVLVTSCGNLINRFGVEKYNATEVFPDVGFEPTSDE